MSSRDSRPESDAPDLHGGEEGRRVFGISSGNAAPPLEMQEGVFDQVAQLVEVFIVWPLCDPVFPRRDHRVHALGCGLLDNRIAVIAFIGNQVVRRDAVDQAASLRTICCGTLCNNDSERQTMRIHGQMYLGVKPPFVRLMS